MKTIKIAHLYYDLLNLYGESGNVRALKKHFEQNDVSASISFLTVGDQINFHDYDIFYFGSGTKESFHIVRKDILKYRSEIQKAIDSGKYFFATGNSLNLFASSYQELDGGTYPVLNLFNYTVLECKKAIVGDVFLKMEGFSFPILGFQNSFSIITNEKEKKLFQVEKENDYSKNCEGITKNHFYGTYLLGPLFIRNPYLLSFFVKQILEEKNIVYQHFFCDYEVKAFYNYLTCFYYHD